MYIEVAHMILTSVLLCSLYRGN